MKQRLEADGGTITVQALARLIGIVAADEINVGSISLLPVEARTVARWLWAAADEVEARTLREEAKR